MSIFDSFDFETTRNSYVGRNPTISSSSTHSSFSTSISIEEELFNAASRGLVNRVNYLLQGIETEQEELQKQEMECINFLNTQENNNELNTNIIKKKKINITKLINGYNIIHILAKKNNFTLLKLILDSFPSLYYSKTSEGKTFEMILIYYNYLETLKYFLTEDKYIRISLSLSSLSSTSSSHPFPYLTDNLGNSLLHYACWSSTPCVEIISTILQRYPSLLFLPNHESVIPLQYAAANNSFALVEYFFSLYIFLEQKIQEKYQIFEEKNDLILEFIKEFLPLSSQERSYLLEKQNEYHLSLLHNDISSTGFTTLHRAASYGAVDIVKFLLKLKSKQSPSANSDISLSFYPINQETDTGLTCLHMAAKHGHFEVVKLLLEVENINIDAQNAYGMTPLSFACFG